MSLSIATNTLRAVSPHFQRSINLSYDTGNADYVAGYIPTQNGANALAIILRNGINDAHQRAHVLHAAYGSGKSLLGLVLSAFASKDKAYCEALPIIQERISRTFPVQGKLINEYQTSKVRLLPVILSGDEGHFSTALARALSNALAQRGLSQIQLRTQFQSALEMISQWEQKYPDAYERFQTKLYQENMSLENFVQKLETLQSDALVIFEQIYPSITAGAQFDRYAGPTLNSVFHTTAEALHVFGYTGILIIWDEFGRFLDNRAEDVFDTEAALLQSFAEFCNRSGPNQVHLVLITHRIFSGYASSLPPIYQQEWARIAERFWTHDISSDPAVSYRLITEALYTPYPDIWLEFSEHHSSVFNQLTSLSLELSLFDEIDDVVLRQHIIEKAWPLHPLVVYALPRLASRVAQNERTLFTFLTSDEPYSLSEQLAKRKESSSWWLIGLDSVWDYFSEAIRTDVGPSGTHVVWSGVMHALSKISHDDIFTQSLIKALGILLIVGEINVQSHLRFGHVIPSTEVLAWAIGASNHEVIDRLDILSNRKVIIFRKSEAYWNFTRGSDIDLEVEINAVLERRSPSRLQIRQIIEHNLPLSFQLPRSYNLEHSISRFFWELYRWPEEINSAYSETFLKQLGSNGYADGAIVYLLTTNSLEREQAITTIRTLPYSRVVFVVPDQPLLLLERARELSALMDLSNNIVFMQQDERLQNEITFFIEDARHRLEHALHTLHDFTDPKSTWWWHNGTNWISDHLKSVDISRLLSQLCTQWFNETPILNNELINNNNPTGQQVRAAEKVIDILLSHPYDAIPSDLLLTGHGPDWLIARTLLIRTGLLHPTATGNWCLRRPINNSLLAHIWDVVQDFLDSSTENEQEIEMLLDRLQSPPFGLRRGVISILLAAMMRPRLPVLTIKQNRKVISPISGQVFTTLCQQPDHFTIEVGPWDNRREALWKILLDRIESFLVEQEMLQQPLSVLNIGLLRWLQSQPRYCRDTNQISSAAQNLRNLIRKAQRDPGRVLSYDLLELLEDGNIDPNDNKTYAQALANKLSLLMDEVASAYQTLLYSLDCFAEEIFVQASSMIQPNGPMALRSWLASIEQQLGKELKNFRFSDQVAQRLIHIVYQDVNAPKGEFWNQLSLAVLGVALHDWNDRSEETFKRDLLDIKERVEREVFDLAKDESVVKLTVSLPDQKEHMYRFRPSDLSPQGQRILQNFKSTLEIAGRPLSPDERRQIVLALLDFVLGESKTDDQQGNNRNRKR